MDRHTDHVKVIPMYHPVTKKKFKCEKSGTLYTSNIPMSSLKQLPSEFPPSLFAVEVMLSFVLSSSESFFVHPPLSGSLCAAVPVDPAFQPNEIQQDSTSRST